MLTAAEKLAAHTGAWGAVWDQYRDSYTSFPKVMDQLLKVQPPSGRGLFDDISGYPQANEDAETKLRYQLATIGAKSPSEARAAILEAEKTHGERRQWLWSRMGKSPIASALGNLAEVASLSAQIPSGVTLAQIAEKYVESGWKVDAAALAALGAVQAKADVESVSGALRAAYVPWLEDTALRFQEVTKAEGGLNAKTPRKPAGAPGLCTVFVDGLRYDVGIQLKERLSTCAEVKLSCAWTSIPSVTASGKAWVSPVAHAIAGGKLNADFQPGVAADGKPLNTYNFRKLQEDAGIQMLDKHETGDPNGQAWVECGDLDHYGHEHGLRLARDVGTQLDRIVERILELKEAGWARLRVVTDHGWLLVPGGLPKTELSKHEAETRWGRCAILKDSSAGTPLTFGWDWCKDVQIAMAPGISSFIAGAEYAHGGLTLQECLVPVLEIAMNQPAVTTVKADIAKVTWKGLRCHVEVVSATVGLRVDIRTKASLASSSLAASVKVVEEGQAAVVVADDSQIGAAAVVVVLDGAGAVVQKVATTVGE